MSLPENLFARVEAEKGLIGELLLKHTALTEDQLDEAIEIQHETGGMLGQILLQKNYIHPHDIIRVLCQQFGIPHLEELKVDDIDGNILRDIPINYAKHHEVLPIFENEDMVTIAMSDPFNSEVTNDIRSIFNKEVQIVVTTSLKIQDAINKVYEKANKNLIEDIEDEFEENLDLDGPIDILDAAADEAPVIRFINSIIFRAVKEKASDIHVEPYEKDVIFRFRINGVMTEILRQPIKTMSAISARIKVMGKLDIAEKRTPQDGRIKIKIAGKDIDIRLNTVPVQHGERLVMRILEKSNTVLELEQLGYHGTVLEQLDALCRLKHGVVYVCGPTGSGKTTTLFAMLDRIKTPDKMIITVEDPVEYEILGISQIQVNHKIDLSFSKALRAILRQDPDVIMVGETRDSETAEMAINASLTGHFVLSTIHTNDSASAPTRLIDMGVQPFLISSSLTGILSQRLMRKLCKKCKVEEEPSEYQLQLLGIEKVPEGAKIFAAKGCPKCNHTGYDGRTCINELLLVDDNIRALILRQADAGTIKKQALKNGMITLRRDAINKVFSGISSLEELLRVINADEEG